MKKGLKKLVISVVTAMTLALPISISLDSQKSEAAILPSYDEFIKGMESIYGKDWVNTDLDNWYNTSGVVRPPVLDKQ